MYKPIFTNILLLLIFTACEKPVKRVPKVFEKKPIERQYGGEVKSIKYFKCPDYYLSNDNLVFNKSDCYLSSHADYDQNEILIKEVRWGYYYDKDVLFSITTQKTDDRGNIIEEVQDNRLGKKITYLYSYNKNGFLTESIRLGNEVLEGKTEYFYDEYNCVIKELRTDENGSVFRTEYKYDNLNREIEFLFHDKFGKPEEKWIRNYKKDSDEYDYKKYDGQGFLTFDSIEEDNKPEKPGTERVYYPNGEIKKKVGFQEGYGWHHSEYNESGQEIEYKVYNPDMKWIQTHKRQYREDGVLIEEEKSQANPYERTTTFYKNIDRNKNWTMSYFTYLSGDQTKYSDLSYREIEYWR